MNVNDKLSVAKSPNDPSSPTANLPVEPQKERKEPFGAAPLLGGPKTNPSDWPRNQQSGINSSSSPTNTSPDFESGRCETAAVTPTDRMVLLERNLKAELARRKEDVKKKETSAKSVSNKDNRGGLLGQWYRLRYSLRTFVGSWRAWDDAKLEWYLARNGPPNDPSSATADLNASNKQEAESAVRCGGSVRRFGAAVRCGAWLGRWLMFKSVIHPGVMLASLKSVLFRPATLTTLSRGSGNKVSPTAVIKTTLLLCVNTIRNLSNINLFSHKRS
jgi:hypothetical protein